MSVRKRKTPTPWSVCDNCKTVVLQKDTSVHKEDSCPPNFTSWTFPFITENRLYTLLEVFQIQDASLKHIPFEERDDLVLIPMQTLQLMEIGVGDPVLIVSQKTNFVKTAWPVEESKSPSYRSSLLTIYLSTETLTLSSLSTHSQLILSRLEKGVLPAKEVTIQCESHFEQPKIKNLVPMIGEENFKKIYTNHNKFFLKHYGKKLIFRILNLKGYEETGEEKHFGNVEVQQNFYLITDQTKWKINREKGSNVSTIISLNSIGGLDDTITELQDIVSRSLDNKTVLPGFHVTRGVIVFGPAGTGKTTLVEAVAQSSAANIVEIQCAEIFSKYLGETEKKLHSYFAQAIDNAPSIIIIDDLDTLCPRVHSRSEQEKRLLTTLSSLMDRIQNDAGKCVIVLATTSRINSIDKSLRRAGRFDKEMEIYVPTPSERLKILKILLHDVTHTLNDTDLFNLSNSCHGFVGADLRLLVSKAVSNGLKTSCNDPTSLFDFQCALSKIKPSAMREIMIDIPNVKWSDIGGQKELKLKLKQAVEWPLKYPKSFERMGVSPPKGLLMFGPPGCSKTLFAKALATESKLNFLSVKGPELFSKWVGESEKAVREVFRKARQAAPSIIFFDEIDALGGERSTSTGGSNVQERVLAQLLTELDGVEPLGNVTVLAASNRPDRIDPALLRPGRLDCIIYVPLPDKDTRKEIFDIQFRKTPVSKDVSVSELVDKTEGYSGAEIIAVCHEAALKALEDDMDAIHVTKNHFLIALKIITPRTSPRLLNIYDSYQNK